MRRSTRDPGPNQLAFWTWHDVQEQAAALGHYRAIKGGQPGSTAVLRGACLRRSGKVSRTYSRSSKLAMRVRFPSPALVISVGAKFMLHRSVGQVPVGQLHVSSHRTTSPSPAAWHC